MNKKSYLLTLLTLSPNHMFITKNRSSTVSTSGKMSKVIFLDVDGVLCINGKFYSCLIKNLKKIIDKTDAIIVLSSNWRLYPQYRERLEKILGKYEIKIQGYTESIDDERPLEIYNWIVTHKPQMCVIIDDRALDKEKHGHKIKDLIIKTNDLFGLTDACVNRASFMLNMHYLFYDLHMSKILNTKHFTGLTYRELYKQKKKYEQETSFLPTLKSKKNA